MDGFKCRRRLRRSSRKIFPVPAAQLSQKYHFAPVTISTLLSYTKMVKTAAIKRVFATKNKLLLWYRDSVPDHGGRVYPDFWKHPLPKNAVLMFYGIILLDLRF